MFAKTLLLTAGLAALGAAAAEPVSSVEKSFSGANAIEITGFIGTLDVRPGRTLSIEMMGAPEGGPLDVSDQNGTIVIKGDANEVKKLYRRGPPYRKGWGNWNSDDAITKFGEFLEDYPVLSVTLPEGGDLKIETSALIAEADMNFGELNINDLKEVYGTFGDAKSLKAGIGGMGELSFGNVEGDADIGIGGSGDVYMGNAGKATVRIGGSGDVDLGTIKEGLEITIGGSGDVAAKDVGGLEVSIGGSGDVETGNVRNGVLAKINGSGDISVGTMAGDLQLGINGSGDIDIDGGKSSSTLIKINGSGDVHFGGVANDPTVSVHGAGDVDIEDYTGKVTVSGDKDDVRIGDLTFDDDDR